jgi:hypothetical protein
MLGIDLRGRRAECLVERKGWTDQGFRDVGGAMLVAGIDNLPLASSMARYRLTLARCQAPRGCGTNRQTQLRADAPGRCAEEKQRADDCDAAPAIIRISGARAFCPPVALIVLDHWATAEPALVRSDFPDSIRNSSRSAQREYSWMSPGEVIAEQTSPVASIARTRSRCRAHKRFVDA